MARQGNPVVALTMSPEEVELVDTFLAACGSKNRSEALRKAFRFAFGNNSAGVSVTDDIPWEKGERVEELRRALLKTWQS